MGIINFLFHFHNYNFVDSRKLGYILNLVDCFDLDICKIFYYSNHLYIHRANFEIYNKLYKDLSIIKYRNIVDKYITNNENIELVSSDRVKLKRFIKYFFKFNFSNENLNNLMEDMHYLFKFMNIYHQD